MLLTIRFIATCCNCIRTVPVPIWVKETLDVWLAEAGVESGPLFRCVCRAGKPWGNGISEKTVWHVVKKSAATMNIPHLARHLDRNLTFVKTC